AMQTEDQTSREVNQTLGVAVDHLGQVHDHRNAFPEVFSDRTRLVVGAWMERGDSCKVCGGGGHGGFPASLTRSQVIAAVGHFLAPYFLTPRAGSVAITLLVHDLVETVELIIFVRITVIVTVVLHEAEVDRHLAHRAGHLMSSVVPAAFSPQPTLLRTEPVCPCTGGRSEERRVGKAWGGRSELVWSR